ncbi:HEPN domain-containing protein [Plesiomonas shigelloides]|uniref:HEPN domain-containing protein n=1 Tax=Plesiomonas shigelloides TaxID=703 RepID=UPI0012627B93|nr:HEPN domain-containing protein [Plesiomonas shigelloides]KAB7663902.1 HEPN domain-containing protein [Plesiomonas shigelloides]
MSIGKFRNNVSVSTEFAQLSRDDEAAADLLAERGQLRQACYFIIQAMEKSIRAKIFTLVNPNIEYFRDRNRTHSLDSAVEFLIEIISTDNIIQNQVSLQLKSHVLGNTNYRYLHNNLRYPTYSHKYDTYSTLTVSLSDFTKLKNRLLLLRVFLNDLHRFI